MTNSHLHFFAFPLFNKVETNFPVYDLIPGDIMEAEVRNFNCLNTTDIFTVTIGTYIYGIKLYEQL